MKRLMIALISILALSLYGEYKVNDIVENFTWQDSDGGVPVERSLYDLVDSGKVVLITWGYNG